MVAGVIIAISVTSLPEETEGLGAGGDRNTCTRQEILTPCQVKQLSQKSSNKLVSAIVVVHISILFIL